MAVNFSALNTAYNYYLTSYAPKSSTSFDTHKKSELRRVYNSIVKLNKESPLYLFNENTDYKSFAVNMKENARSFRNTIASLGGLDEDEFLNKKVAYSSNESLVTAEYIGNPASVNEADTLEIQINTLASPQVNMGTFLPSSKSSSLKSDTYSFDLSINDLNYEFQFGINDEDTNGEIQNRLCRLINNAEIGVTAEILEDESGNSSLKLFSNQTGLSEGREFLFRISDEHTSMTSGAVEYFGIGEITRNASNAEFTINGISHTTYSNHFTIEKMYEISLNGLSESEDDIAVIGIKNDTESLRENLQVLIGGYNHFLKTASEYVKQQPGSNRLVSEMSHITASYSSELEPLGIHMTENGSLSLDNKQLSQVAFTQDTKETFRSVRNFTNSVLQKTNSVSLNPMEYADKKVVAYKNPGKNFANPYVTSSYSGMLFNSYC